MRLVWLVAAAAFLFSCAAPPTAVAAPPSFPDLNAFSAVDPAPYISVGIKGGRGIAFVTERLRCAWPLRKDPNQHELIGCTGLIPGLPAEVPTEQYSSACAGIAGDKFTGIYAFSRGDGSCAPPFPDSPRLAVGSKITAANVTCAVTGDGLACIDPIINHGFVLQQPLSWVF